MHIVKRGINHQDIFIDKSDYEFFLKLLSELKGEMGFDIIAYCLMSNHFHLLLHDGNAQFSKIVQRLMTRYVMHFNWKYNRTGSLCEGRYTGRVIENEAYLLTAVRYIHNNPVSAGLSLAEDYQWSSYSEYIGEVTEKTRLCNTDVILNLFSSKDTFIDFHRAVINADDYYGVSAYQSLYDFLTASHESNPYPFCMVGYELKNTLTENGSVARGCCQMDANGMLETIDERTNIIKTPEGASYSKDDGQTYIPMSADSLVSMNMWGFTPDIFPELDKSMKRFFKEDINVIFLWK